MKKQLRSFAAKYAPELLNVFTSYRTFSHCKKRFGAFQDEFALSIYGDEPIRILDGPFEGTTYFNKIIWGAITPRWIGSYETELHDIVDEIIGNRYERILDVGAAEGYYAIGLARKCPETQVLSFDVDPIARKRQLQLAGLNSIQNLHIGKYCSHATLREELKGHCLLISDIEGYEYELLNPESAATLRDADILIEVHPWGSMSTSEVKTELVNRFRDSHDITEIAYELRKTSDWMERVPALQKLNEQKIGFAVQEHRDPKQEWLWMKTKSSRKTS